MSNQQINTDKQPHTVYIVNGGEKLEENFATVCPVAELECIENVYLFTPSELSSLIAEKQREAAENSWKNGFNCGKCPDTSFKYWLDRYLNINYPINK